MTIRVVDMYGDSESEVELRAPADRDRPFQGIVIARSGIVIRRSDAS